MPELIIASMARADLRNVRIYSKAAFGPQVALSCLDGLRERFVAASLRQEAGRIGRDLGENIRSIGFRAHRIRYRTTEDRILIIRVLDHAQDVRAAFETAS